MKAATELHICWLHCVVSVAGDKSLQNLMLGVCWISRTLSTAICAKCAALALESIHFPGET